MTMGLLRRSLLQAVGVSTLAGPLSLCPGIAADPSPTTGTADAPPTEYYEIWYQEKGKKLRKYSEAATRAKAEEVIKALKVPGGASEIRGPFFKPVPGSKNNPFQVPKGQVTFDSEGTEGGPYHTRKAHVPTDSSGLTIGRGYDMKEKTKDQIKKDLMAAGLSEADATLFAGAAGLSGASARKYITDNKLPEITPEQQKALFAITYAAMEADVKRIASKADVVAKYGATDWDKLDPAIKDLLVDLRYRGDYTPGTRAKIQEMVSKNDVRGIATVMADEKYWVTERGVPKDRFQRRKALMDKAVAALPPPPKK